MKKTRLILAFFVLASLVASVSYAEDIIVDEASTICSSLCPSAVFTHFSPFGFRFKFTVEGESGVYYRVKTIIEAQSLGAGWKWTNMDDPEDPHPYVVQGGTSIEEPNPWPTYGSLEQSISDDVACGIHEVKFTFRLRQGGGLLYEEIVYQDTWVIDDYFFGILWLFKFNIYFTNFSF